MANISSFLNTIKTAIYGKDMRSAIHEAIDLVNKESENNTENVTNIDKVLGSENLGDNTVTELLNIHEDNIIQLEKSMEEKADKTQYASTTEYGLVKLSQKGGILYSNGLTVNTNTNYGTSRTDDGKVVISAATEEDIDARSNEYKPITPATLDYAVNSVLEDITAVNYLNLFECDYTQDGFVYVTNKPDYIYSGEYLFVPEKDIQHICCVNAEGDEIIRLDYSFTKDKLYVLSLKENAGKSEVLCEFMTAEQALATANKSIANLQSQANSMGAYLTQTATTVNKHGEQLGELSGTYVPQEFSQDESSSTYYSGFENMRDLADCAMDIVSLLGKNKEFQGLADVAYCLSETMEAVAALETDVSADSESVSATAELADNAVKIYTNKSFEALKIVLPGEVTAGFMSGVTFLFASETMNLDIPDDNTVEYTGIDCINGVFVPTNVGRSYDMVYEYNGIDWKCRIG